MEESKRMVVMVSSFLQNPHLCGFAAKKQIPINKTPTSAASPLKSKFLSIIGVFGHYDSLTIDFGRPIEGVTHFWAQDLLAEVATDILKQATIIGSTINIPGKLIDRIGTSAGDAGDISVPGLVLRLEQTTRNSGERPTL